MREKLYILISLVLIYSFISSDLFCAEDIKVNKKISEKSYKFQELKNNFLKIEIKKIPVITFRTEISGMSKVSAALLGGGIGLVGGAVIGGVIGSIYGANSSEASLHVGLGVGIGGLSGLVIGGVTGYILGK